MARKVRSENRRLFELVLLFVLLFFLPFSNDRVTQSILEAFAMLGEYVHLHVLTCLVPAFFIAGALTVFLNGQSVIKYLGPKAPRAVAYSVASVSGAILAVCSCTVLPLFKGIYRKGAGIGPAVSFLYSGPAVNILAIVLSFKVFGWQLGTARLVGSIGFALAIGFVMQRLFHKDDERRLADERMFSTAACEGEHAPGGIVLLMVSLIGILLFLNWAPSQGTSVVWDFLFRGKYLLVGLFALLLAGTLVRWYGKDDLVQWGTATRDFALQILPLLLAGVLVAGFLLGRPGHEALLPSSWIARAVGGNSLGANFLASIAGAFMYFATLTEVPILQGLMGSGMGQGPALALLLAGPSLSLPSMLVIGGELGARKTIAYILLVVLFSTIAGFAYGIMVG